MPSITPFLWFDTDLVEPIRFYTSIFPDAASPDVREPLVTARSSRQPSSCTTSV